MDKHVRRAGIIRAMGDVAPEDVGTVRGAAQELYNMHAKVASTATYVVAWEEPNKITIRTSLPKRD